MDELTVADVHTDVRGSAAIAKIDNVARTHIIVFDIGAVCQLRCCGAVDAVAELREDILHKAGAVKAGRGRAAVNIRIADKLLCVCSNFLTAVRRGAAGGTAVAIRGRA